MMHNNIDSNNSNTVVYIYIYRVVRNKNTYNIPIARGHFHNQSNIGRSSDLNLFFFASTVLYPKQVPQIYSSIKGADPYF